MSRIILALVLLAVLVPMTSGQSNASQTAGVVFTFEEGVPAEDEALIREGVRFAQEYAAATLGRTVERPFRVDVRPVQEYDVPGYVASGVLHLATDQRFWRESPPMRRLKIVLHEFFHLVQYETVQDIRPMPLWMAEGSAELFAFEAVASLGLVNWDAVVDSWIFSTVNAPTVDGFLLEAMAVVNPALACCLYTVSPLAANELLKAGGWESFLAYFDVFNTMPPDDAFAESFGLSLTGFYAAFENARWNMVTSGVDQSALRLPWNPVDWGADVWGASARSPVERGGQAFLTAWSVPGVRCTLDFVSASGNHLLTQETHANQDGLVFWLFSVRERLSEGDARADVTCGTNAVSVAIELT